MNTAINPKNPPITLEFVKSKFDHWRQTRKCRSKIPDELWEYAKLLYPQYRITKLCNTLKLSSKDFRLKLMLPISTQIESVSFAQCVLPVSFPIVSLPRDEFHASMPEIHSPTRQALSPSRPASVTNPHDTSVHAPS